MLCPASRLQVLGLTGNVLLGDCTSQRSWGPAHCFPSLAHGDAHPSPPAQASHVARHGQTHSGSGPMCLGVCASQMPKSATAICCLGKGIVHWEHHCSGPTEAAAGAGTCHSRDHAGTCVPAGPGSGTGWTHLVLLILLSSLDPTSLSHWHQRGQCSECTRPSGGVQQGLHPQARCQDLDNLGPA